MYNSEWAREVVKEFEGRHVRGVQLVQDIYRLPPEFAERLLMDNGQRWCGYKSLVKHVERFEPAYRTGYEGSRDFGSNYYTFVKYLRRVLKRRPFPSTLDLLDEDLSEDYPSQAPQEGDGPSEVTSEGRQFLFF